MSAAKDATSTWRHSMTASPHGEGCGDLFWIPLGKKCFRLIPCATCSWDTMRATCSQLGGSLASLSSNDEKAFVARLLPGTEFAHVGGYCSTGQSPCPAADWKWADESPPELLKADGGVVPNTSGKYLSLGLTSGNIQNALLPTSNGLNYGICSKLRATSQCSTVKMESASYGENCKSSLTDNVLPNSVRYFEGRYGKKLVMGGQWGDPAPGCHKEFTAKWKCGTESKSVKVGQGCAPSGGGQGSDCSDATFAEIVIGCSPGEGVEQASDSGGGAAAGGEPAQMLASFTAMSFPQPIEIADTLDPRSFIRSTALLSELDRAGALQPEFVRSPQGHEYYHNLLRRKFRPVNMTTTTSVSFVEIETEGSCSSPCPMPSVSYKSALMPKPPQAKAGNFIFGVALKEMVDELQVSVASIPQRNCAISAWAPVWALSSNAHMCAVYDPVLMEVVPANETSNLGIKFEIKFYEPCGTAVWSWRAQPDFTGGGAVFLDGIMIWERPSGYSEPLELGFGKISKGEHVLQLYGYVSTPGDAEKGGMSFKRVDIFGGNDWKPLYPPIWTDSVCKADCIDLGFGGSGAVDYWVQPIPDPPSIGQTVKFSKTASHVASVGVFYDKAHAAHARSQACPSGRQGHSSAYYNGRMYIFGGVSNDPVLLVNFLNDLWAFELATETWIEYYDVMGNLPAPRAGACMGVESALGDVIVTMGYGEKSPPKAKPEGEKKADSAEGPPEGIEPSLAEQDAAEEKAKTEALAKKQEALAVAAAAAERQNIGFQDTWRYNFKSGIWEEMSPLPDGDYGIPAPREYPGCALVDKRLYLYGGFQPNRKSEVFGDMWYYDFAFDQGLLNEEDKGDEFTCVGLLRGDPTLKSGIYKISPEKPKKEEEEKDPAAQPAAKPADIFDFGGEIGDGWALVRHVPAGANFFGGNDNLAGTDSYGTFVADLKAPEGFSVKFFDRMYDELLFATGDMEKWLIVSVNEISRHGAPFDAKVTKSSLNQSPHRVKWFNRAGNAGDPLISLTDCPNAVKTGDVLYGENGISGQYSTILTAHKGANVFIRMRPSGDVDPDPPSFETFCDMDTLGGGWTLVAYAQDCLLPGRNMERWWTAFNPKIRDGSANVNALRVAKHSQEVLYAWDMSAYPTGGIRSYGNSFRHLFPPGGVSTMAPQGTLPNNAEYVKMPIEIVRNKNGFWLPKEMYTRRGSLMAASNAAFGVVRESRTNPNLDWLTTDAEKGYSAFYVGLLPLKGNTGLSQVTPGTSNSVISTPKTCSIWMR
eukprot:c20095_g1_i2.p1 GENE.c20095_g1_i2~~c20095_g1_i2.p1  ORF type:complete len:1320 (+),score=300.95 c20095_g1_i2:163-3960(+)